MMKDATIWKGNPVNIRNYYKELMKDINNRNFLVNTVDDIIENEKFEEPLVLSNTLDYPDPVISESVPKINEEVFKELNIKNQGDCLFDYDGTLVEVKPKPEDAKPTKELIEFFLKHKDRIVLCIGRAQEIIDSWFPKGISVYAEHGAMFRNSEGEWEFLNGATKGVIQEVKDLICYYSLRLKDSIVEKKTCGYVFHFKLCKQPNAELIVKKLIRDLSNLRLVYKGFSVIRGKGVIEIKQGCRGTVAKNCTPWMVAGDDVTDEYMFANAPKALKVKVGQGPTSADYFVDSVQDFLNFVSFVLSE
ncbi:TPSP [Hepatospora eriocheir]|uniref:TPSP n=1 Tax=Hepatospora eriocheir TaxID=1081669 RepID=A0A1X0QEP7_9MICR|nr:TPSP [Hepatospora eriocheir]